MATINEMNKWNYSKAWKFFLQNASGKLIPESKLYLKSLVFCSTEDIREDSEAMEKILRAVQGKTLTLIDGASLNGKSTLAERLAKFTNANIVDIDMICKEWIENELAKIKDPSRRFAFLMNMDKLTDEYILNNLERIVREYSKKGSVILVGCYMEVMFRAIIAKTLGKYFEKTISIYCCARSFKEVREMKVKRDKEFGNSSESEANVLNQYNFSKRLLEEDGIMLGFGMTASFIADTKVSDMFV